MRIIAGAAIAAIINGCVAATTPGAGAHLSAAQEEVAAARQDQEAAAHRAHYDPRATQRKEICVQHGDRASDGTGFEECWESVVNPTASQLDEAKQHERVAAQRRATSSALTSAEARACSGLSAYDRDTSPFVHRDDIRAVELTSRGAIITFKHVPTLTPARLQAIIDCHIARNDALGHDVPEMADCPLVPRDVRATVRSAADGMAVTVESSDAQGALDVRARASKLQPR